MKVSELFAGNSTVACVTRDNSLPLDAEVVGIFPGDSFDTPWEGEEGSKHYKDFISFMEKMDNVKWTYVDVVWKEVICPFAYIVVFRSN